MNYLLFKDVKNFSPDYNSFKRWARIKTNFSEGLITIVPCSAVIMFCLYLFLNVTRNAKYTIFKIHFHSFLVVVVLKTDTVYKFKIYRVCIWSCRLLLDLPVSWRVWNKFSKKFHKFWMILGCKR